MRGVLGLSGAWISRQELAETWDERGLPGTMDGFQRFTKVGGIDLLSGASTHWQVISGEVGGTVGRRNLS